MAYLKSSSEKEILAGLQGLHALSAMYEFEKDNTARELLNQMVIESFVVLLPLVNKLMENKEQEDALKVLHLIFKVFYKFNAIEVSACLMEGNNLDPWI